MPKLIINKLGPVETCELECSQFMNFTGFQASGKSTIAKAIYYFRTIKDDIIELAKSQALDATPAHTIAVEHVPASLVSARIHSTSPSRRLLAKLLKEKGFPIARRTVAKYREQLGIPVARLRK